MRLYAVSTVAEEIGLRGAMTSTFGIRPQVGIAIDVTHATDCPTIDKKQEGDIALGKGPVIYRGPNMNPRVVERLFAAAKARDIGYQTAASGRATSNDANTIQISRWGVAAGLVSLPTATCTARWKSFRWTTSIGRPICWPNLPLSLAGDEDFRP